MFIVENFKNREKHRGKLNNSLSYYPREIAFPFNFQCMQEYIFYIIGIKLHILFKKSTLINYHLYLSFVL